jgi:PhnB protein
MKYSRSRFTPEGWHTVTPRIVANDAEKLVAFLGRVFGATGAYRPDLPSVMKIGDTIVMVSDAGIRDPMRAFLYVYVDDVDAAYRRALQAGATSLEVPSDTPYGDRRCTVKDAWGNTCGARAGSGLGRGYRVVSPHDAVPALARQLRASDLRAPLDRSRRTLSTLVKRLAC